MTQENLFGPPAVARKTDPDTSHEAAATVNVFKGANELDLGLTDNQAAVYLFLKSRSLTDEELVAEYEQRYRELGMPQQSPSGLRTRRAELRDRGFVWPDGFRFTEAGNRAQVWGAA